jgi:hypothetical protein
MTATRNSHDPLTLPGVKKAVRDDLNVIEKSARALKQSIKSYPKACPSNDMLQALLGQMIMKIELTVLRLRGEA